ncbi:hypothetical protein GCM10018966_005400 [Streptomyces yanii]
MAAASDAEQDEAGSGGEDQGQAFAEVPSTPQAVSAAQGVRRERAAPRGEVRAGRGERRW